MVKTALLSDSILWHYRTGDFKLLKKNGFIGPKELEIYCGRMDDIMIYLVPVRQDFFEKAGKLLTERYRVLFRGLRLAGCNSVFSTSGCASLQEEIRPGEVIIPDQFIDLSFREGIERVTGLSGHQMTDPFSSELRDHLTEAAIVNGITVHTKGTVVIQGQDRTSTRAESMLYHKWGGDITGPSISVEAMVALTEEMAYACVLLCRKYDVWRLPSPDLPSQEEIENDHYKVFDIIQYAMKKLVLRSH